MENTFVLSGGLLAAAYRCPQLLVGQPPSEAEIIAGLQLKTQGHRGLAGATPKPEPKPTPKLELRPTPLALNVALAGPYT